MESENISLPLVEIFETVEGEGNQAGFHTIFIRLFGCNLRCSWCDTPYSYAPAKPEMKLSIKEIVNQVSTYKAKNICLTGGEPLLFGKKSVALINELLKIDGIQDLHVETNGAIDLLPFINSINDKRVRFIMDYKLSGSNERDRMLDSNLAILREFDELKFVIGSDLDFFEATEIINNNDINAQILFSPVWETMTPRKLVEKIISNGLSHVKLSLQLHKIIWDPATRGV